MKARPVISAAALGLLTAFSAALVVPAAQADRGVAVHSVPHRHDRAPDRHRPVYPSHRRGHDHRDWRPHYRPRHYHYYPGYYGDEPWRYFSFTAIALKVLDMLDADQQRRHEAALAAAVQGRPGEVITWHDGNASGSVQTTRVGTSSSGRQCREFQQTVTVGGRTEQAYGTACLQPDGSWEIISTQ